MDMMLAARYHAQNGKFRLEHVPVPKAGPGEVVVKVAACGICISDVHSLQGLIPTPVRDGLTLGHEASGTVAEVGSEVPGRWSVGDRVVLSPGQRCRECENCLKGYRVDECLSQRVMASAYDGAWAEYVLVDYQQLVRIPDSLDFAEAAVLADAVTTPYAGLLDTARLRPAESIGIWGLGGLGTHAVQLARIFGASPIVAVDIDGVARQRALELGADVAIDPLAEDFIAKLAAATANRGLDVAADFVGTSQVRAQVFAALGHAGRAALIGITPEPIVLHDSFTPIIRMQSFAGHLGGFVRHLEDLVQLSATGRLSTAQSISEIVPLSEIESAITALQQPAHGRVRIVVRP